MLFRTALRSAANDSYSGVAVGLLANPLKTAAIGRRR
jgi:hypothetical protein